LRDQLELLLHVDSIIFFRKKKDLECHTFNFTKLSLKSEVLNDLSVGERTTYVENIFISNVQPWMYDTTIALPLCQLKARLFLFLELYLQSRE